jgi:hypothetical protein
MTDASDLIDRYGIDAFGVAGASTRRHVRQQGTALLPAERPARDSDQLETIMRASRASPT